ncbi:hypothetical protein G7045_05855 [Acidovorax sp. HDW3]|uniref:hypothetical protein n=1 Tax=Acidovorax sp. HDW3 TaxID=2714923 RepID=UPI00140AA586|nr:hypothetical protein [Acidovorax sp. HDW3]QIL43822.1 hypothetical protein G7045_05855 [Acidovorax sp. HDW3]
MSTEYVIVVTGSIVSEYYPELKRILISVQKRSAPYVIEGMFAEFGEVADGLFSALLDDHLGLFFSLIEVSETNGDFRWGWEGYGYAESFLQDVLQLFDLFGLQNLKGEVYGDEEIYRCIVTADSIDCEYVER